MMRRLIITLTMLFACAFSAQAQFNYPIGTPTWYKKVRVDDLFWLNTTDTVSAYATQYPGALTYRVADKGLYLANGIKHIKIGSGSSGGGIDSAWRSNDTLYFRYTSGASIGVKMDYYTKAVVNDSLSRKVDTVYWNSTNDTIYIHTGRSLYRLPVINWNTPMTPLMTQPALPPQPTDPIPVITGKLTALFNSISGTYIENQKTTDQVADMRISGDVQSSGVGLFGGWYTSGLQGPINHIGVTGGVAQLMAFNRTTSAYFPLSINASSTAINGGSSGNVAIRKSSPTFNLDVTGTTRIEGANYKLFLDRSAMATQDNIIAFRSPGLNTSTDTIGYLGNASRTTNDIFLLARQADLIFRLPVNNTLHFGTHVDGNGISRKDVTTMRNGKWLWADSITTTPLYPIHVINTQDTSIFTEHKVVAGGVESSGAISTPFLGTAITTSTALNDAHHTVRVTTSGITLTLPAASSRPGREFYIVNHSAGTITISPNYINLAGASASVVAANSAFIFQSDGTNWYLIK